MIPIKEYISVLYYKDEATYNAFKAVCPDKDSFHLPYADWVARGVEFEKRFNKEGATFFKAEAKLDEFLEWANKENGGAKDSISRQKFAIIKYHASLKS